MADISKKTSKDIKYLGRDFDSLKKGLVDFAKIYYPSTYNDFNEASPGMMFIEMAAYVGDVLNYYVDSQFKESLLLHATERRSILSIASAMGYKPKLSVPSITEVDVYQLLPASGSGANVVPDLRYSLKVEPGFRVRSSTNRTEFIIQNKIDFGVNNIFEPTSISVYSIDNAGAPNYFLAKKTSKAISATPVVKTFAVGDPQRYYKILIEDTNLIAIDSMIDADGNDWYEVPYLAQDTIFEKVDNTAYNDPNAAVYGTETPYLLKLKRVPRRFVARVVERGLEIQFGAGVSSTPDEELLATPENIGLSLPTGKDDIDFSIDPAAPVHTGAYGVTPSNTTLTITYLVGGGVSSNVPSNTITEIVGVNTDGTNLPTDNTTLNTTILQSLAVNNPIAAAGGRSSETLDEIRQNALAQVASQNRAVTKEDYIIRAYAMPNVYGSVAKVYITPDEQNNITTTSDHNDTVSNPLAMNMYMLGYDNEHRLVNVNRAVKENLKMYLGQYRMLTDSINFRDAYIINIGLEFDIIPLSNYNANEVLINCINATKAMFDIDYWQVNQPIVYSDIFNTLFKVAGVQTVTSIRIKNLNDEILGYSNIVYDISGATRNGIIYPSLDPATFEIKYPNNDIKGRIVTF
jgi:hypothetical protein